MSSRAKNSLTLLFALSVLLIVGYLTFYMAFGYPPLSTPEWGNSQLGLELQATPLPLP